MKKFLMMAFAATALLCATSCTKDDEAVGDGTYPQTLTGVWTPEDQDLSAMIVVEQEQNGVAPFTAKIPVQGYLFDVENDVYYDATTGKGRVDGIYVDLPETFLNLMQISTGNVYIEIQGLSANRIQVRIKAVENDLQLLQKNFKRYSQDPADQDDIELTPINPEPQPGPEPEPVDTADVVTYPADATGVYACTKEINMTVVNGSGRAMLILSKLTETIYIFNITVTDLSESLSNMFVNIGDGVSGVVSYDAETGKFSYDYDMVVNQYPDYAALLNYVNSFEAYFVDNDNIHVDLKVNLSEVEAIPENVRPMLTNYAILNDNFVRMQ